jgi:protein SCO1
MRIVRIGQIISLIAIIIIAYLFLTKTNEYQFKVKGRVAGFSNSKTSIIIEHEKIEGYMDAMTMPFKVKDTTAIQSLEIGTPIQFNYYVNLKEHSSYIDQIIFIDEGSLASLGKIAQESIIKAPINHKNRFIQLGDSLPNYVLSDQDNKEIQTADLKGKKVLLTFIYTNCPVPDFCPLMSYNFKEIHKRLSDTSNVVLLSVSFDPKRDTPKVLKKYGQKYTSDFTKWKFISGDQETIEQMTSDFSVITQMNKDQIIHNLRTVYINENGIVQKIWPDNTWKVNEVLEVVLAK